MAKTGEPEAEGAQEEQRQERLRVLDLSAVGLAFPIALLLGYFVGRAIGGWLGSAQLGALIGALVGIAGGFYNLFKMVSRLAPRRVGSGAAPASGANSAGEAARFPVAQETEPPELEDDDFEDDDLEPADPPDGR